MTGAQERPPTETTAPPPFKFGDEKFCPAMVMTFPPDWPMYAGLTELIAGVVW